MVEIVLVMACLRHHRSQLYCPLLLPRNFLLPMGNCDRPPFLCQSLILRRVPPQTMSTRPSGGTTMEGGNLPSLSCSPLRARSDSSPFAPCSIPARSSPSSKLISAAALVPSSPTHLLSSVRGAAAPLSTPLLLADDRYGRRRMRPPGFSSPRSWPDRPRQPILVPRCQCPSLSAAVPRPQLVWPVAGPVRRTRVAGPARLHLLAHGRSGTTTACPRPVLRPGSSLADG